MRAGETLSSIAARLWGDSALWYEIADANGLSGNASLVEGQLLTLPVGVEKARHNATTFTPYDPNKIIGDVSPTTPVQPKAKKKGCGTLAWW